MPTRIRRLKRNPGSSRWPSLRQLALGLILTLILGLSAAGAAPRADASQALATAPAQAAQVWPADWIAALRQGKPDQQLVKAFESRLGLDWPGNGEAGSEIPFVEQGFVSLLEANLDEDAGTEILALIGRNENFTELAVFKQQGDQWLLAGHAPVYTWYYAPEFGLLATGGPRRSLYVRQLENRGTGIYQESYQFFKVIDGQLRSVLRLPLEASLYGWGGLLNQHLQARFQGLAGPDERLRVTYNYRFFAGPEEGDVPWDSHPENVFLADEVEVDYVWDEARKAYFPELESSPLNTIQLESLASLEDPELFARAFEKELRARLATASPTLKKQIQQLLAGIK